MDGDSISEFPPNLQVARVAQLHQYLEGSQNFLYEVQSQDTLSSFKQAITRSEVINTKLWRSFRSNTAARLNI